MIEKFKTSLFGYSKQEVCEYISKAGDELTAKHRAEKKALEDAILALKEENARLRQENERAKEKIAALTSRLTQ